MNTKHLPNWVTRGGIVVCVVALLGIGAFGYSKKAHADEAQPNHSAVMEVTDKNGTRTCDIYPDSDSSLDKVKAYAAEKGCQIKTIFLKTIHKDEVAKDEPQSTGLVAPVVPAPTAKDMLPSIPKAPEVAATK